MKLNETSKGRLCPSFFLHIYDIIIKDLYFIF